MHILHLEDTKPLRDMLKATLETIRPDTMLRQFIASDEAMDYIRQAGSDVDLFLIDVRVPGPVDGLGVAKLIQELGCPGVVVMTSAYRSPGYDTLAELNAHWFQKPWNADDVQEMLRLATARPTS